MALVASSLPLGDGLFEFFARHGLHLKLLLKRLREQFASMCVCEPNLLLLVAPSEDSRFKLRNVIVHRESVARRQTKPTTNDAKPDRQNLLTKACLTCQRVSE